MPRHSKNANARGFNTYYEKKRNQSDLQAFKFGKESTKPFDYCSICLHHVVSPMCCNEGHLFCRECICKYMLSKKKDYEAECEAYERYVQEEEQKVKEGMLNAEHAICDDLERLQTAKGSDSKTMFVTHVASEDEQKMERMKKIVNKLSAKEDIRTEEEKSLKMNFWIPENTPESKEIIQKPSKEIQCPCSNHEISMKKLINLNFAETKEQNSSVLSCPACMKQLQYQQVIAIKECGHVLCGDCFKQFVGPSKQCYVCQKPVLKKKDFVVLESGGTGFSSHNKVDVKVYKYNEN